MKSHKLSLAVLVFLALTCVNWSPEEALISLADSKVFQQHGTVLTPILDEPIAPGRNTLWCASFQIAWDNAAARYGTPLRLLPGSKLADGLNKKRFDPNAIDSASIVTVEGYANTDFYKKIAEKKSRSSGGASKVVKALKASAQPTDFVFYAKLEKELHFGVPFGKLGAVKLGDHSVPWFGFTPEQLNTEPLLQQVGIHHYQSETDFVIELFSKESEDQLLLVKFATPPKTLEEARQKSLQRVLKQPPFADGRDLLAVPNLSIEEMDHFSALEGCSVVGQTVILRKALQSIDFKMDEKGVKLRSESTLSFGCSMQKHIKPRLLVLSPPFAVILKRKNATQPYFMAWIGNADLLKRK